MLPATFKKFSAAATSTLPVADASSPGYLVAPGGTLFNRYAIQVKGVGGTLTSWSVLIEGSLDGLNWTTLATHSATDGSTVNAVDKPVDKIRVNVSALSLGTATSINVFIAASE